MSYDKTLEYLKVVRDKYSDQILSQKGVHAIGVRVHDYRIVVYVNEMSSEIIQNIPLFLDEIPVEIVLQESSPSLCFSGGDRGTPTPGFSFYGTLGSVWFSTKYKQLVGLSNNHVFAKEDMLPKRSTSAPVSVTVGWGVAVPEPEVGYFNMDFPNNGTLGTNGAKITEISVWDGETWYDTTELLTGRYALIRGENFGKEYFFSQNKLFFNDKQIPHYYWSNNAVIFIVPSNLPNNGEIRIQAEGTRILVEDRKRNNKQVNLGELLDYCEVTHTPVDGYDPEIDYHWQWEAENSADVAICTIAPSMLPEAELQIEERSSSYDTDKLYNYYMAGLRSHTIAGIAQNIKEFTPIMFSGSRGTIYCHVTDPSVRSIMKYAKGYSAVNETILYQYTGMSTSTDMGPFPPSSGGSSGSSVLIADIDNLIDYYNHWGIIAPTREQMENALKDDLGNQINFPDYFVGNNFAGITWDFMGFSDIATNWLGRMEILPVSMVPQIDAENSPMKSTSTMIANPTLYSSSTVLEADAFFSGTTSFSVIPILISPITTIADFGAATSFTATAIIPQPLSTDASFSASTFFDGVADVKQDMTLNVDVSFNLARVQLINPYQVDFDLQPFNADLMVSANFDGQTTFQGIAEIVAAMVHEVSANFSGIASMTATTDIVPVVTLQVSATFDASTTFTANVGLTDLNMLEVSATFQGTSYVSAIGVVIGEIADLLASAMFTGITSLQAAARLYIQGTENTQYEYIYFEITRSHDINIEITKSIDLNLAV